MVFFDFWSSPVMTLMTMSSNTPSMTLSEILVTLSSLYGVQLILFVTLGAITIYRREMSCNHCYHPVVLAAAALAATADSAAAAVETDTVDAAVNDASVRPQQGEEQQQPEPLPTEKSSKTSTTSKVSSPVLLLRTSTSTSSCVTVSRDNEDVVVDHHHHGEETCSSSSAVASCEQQECDGEEDAATTAAAASVASGISKNDHHHHALVSGGLAPDAMVHILSFLSPRDVIAFECTCHAARIMVNGNKQQQDCNNDGDDPDRTTSSSSSRAIKMTSTTTSEMLWKTLWRRDYAWIVESWIIGRQAMQRSTNSSTSTSIATTICLATAKQDSSISEQQHFSYDYPANRHNQYDHVKFNKDFYFRFAASWLNYVLAGRNCAQNGCYVGLAGHVYDMSTFVLVHPGSPETVLVQAGRDATSFFVNVRHSMAALRLAKSMCVVVDQSRINVNMPKTSTSINDDDSSKGDDKENNNTNALSATAAEAEKRSSSSSTFTSASCGLRPTRHTRGLGLTLIRNQQQEQLLPKEQLIIPELSLSEMGRGVPSSWHANMLQRIQRQYTREEAQALQSAKQKYATTMRLTDVNVFYNPFLKSWQAWYTNLNMETVFCNVDK